MGAFYVLLSALFFVLSSVYGKIVTNTTGMSGIITSLGRFLIGTVAMFIYMIYEKKNFKPVNFKPIFSRALFNGLTVLLYSIGFQYTTVTNVNMLQMTYPIFIILLTPYFTKEKIKPSTYIYLTIIMASTFIVVNPKFNSVNIGDVLSLLSAITSAVSIMNLTAARRTDEGYMIVFYVMLLGAIFTLPFSYKDLICFESKGLLPLLLSSLFGFLGQVFITIGYKYVDSATGALVSTSRIVFATLIGVLFLGEPINSRIITGGMLIIISLIGLSGYFNKRIKKIKEL